MSFSFRRHMIDQSLPPNAWYAQAALADLDNDGRLEYVVGQRNGDLYWYKMETPDRWTQYLLGTESPSVVGVEILDVDGDGRLDVVAGGAWYRNNGDPQTPFTRHVFDPDLAGIHDIIAADIDGDGRPEIVTMSDHNDVRWYKIADDPTDRWTHRTIGPAVHSGLSIGDLDGDGDLDIVRTNVWFENVEGDGSVWQVRPIASNTYPPPDFQEHYFAYDATMSVVCDMNGDGRSDIVFLDNEIPGGKVWWMENVDGLGREWRRHEIYTPEAGGERRGALHSLHVGDMDADGDFDVVSCEMEWVPGDAPPRYFIWENVDGRGAEWKEHTVLDANLGGHAAVVGDVTGNGLPDIIGKPWRPKSDNALGGKMHVVFLENAGS